MSSLKEPSIQRFELGKLRFSSASKQDLLSILLRHIGRPSSDTPQRHEIPDDNGLCIGYVNPHVYNQSAETHHVQHFINQCDLVCLDGLGTCLALRFKLGLFRTRPVHRVVALHLFDALLENLSEPCTAVLIGVDAQDVQLCAATIRQKNPCLDVTDVMDGFRPAPDYNAFLSRHSTTRLVLIGAGSPKSESIALVARSHCPNAIVFHIGAGTIKVYAGTKRRAAAWVSACGLEWLQRMIFEPHTRERYTLGGWRFIRHVLRLPKQDNNQSLR